MLLVTDQLGDLAEEEEDRRPDHKVSGCAEEIGAGILFWGDPSGGSSCEIEIN